MGTRRVKTHGATDVAKPGEFDERFPEDGRRLHATDYDVKMTDNILFHLDRSLDINK